MHNQTAAFCWNFVMPMIWPLLTRSWNNLLVNKLLFTTWGAHQLTSLPLHILGKIDFVLVQRAWLGTVRQLYSDMNMAFASISP